MIRRGVTRLAFLIGPWAIKLPLPLSLEQLAMGMRGNTSEAVLSGRRGLCPVIWCGPFGLCNIMVRASGLTDEEWAAFDYSKWQESVGDWADNKRSSFGVLNNNIVAIDYGEWRAKG